MLVIGNELLSGKFEEKNVSVLAKELFGLGVKLQRVVVCPDDIDVISSDVRRLADQYDYVFTSGGVGPTHDDVTMEAVADAFSQPLRRHPKLVEMFRGYFADRLTEDHLIMADLPAEAELVWGTDAKWPLVRLQNVFVLPGLPEVFRMKIPLIRAELGVGTPFVSKQVRAQSDEGAIASLLNRLVRDFSDVTIGSYPRWESGSAFLIISFDGTDASRVEAAAAALCEALPAETKAL